MTSKNPPKTTQLCEGVQTSPYSGFICGRAYIKDTDWSPSWILPEKLIKMTGFILKFSHFRVKSSLETSLIFHCIPFPNSTPKSRMFAGGRKEKFVNGLHQPD